MENIWDKRFKTEKYVYGKEPNGYFASKLKDLKPGKIFFPAEGEGRNSVYAATLGWDIDACDYSFEARKKALKFAEEKGVSINYFLQDLSTYKFPGKIYDAIVLVFLHLPEILRKRFHKEVSNSLKKGGYFIAQFYSKNQLKFNSGGPQDIDLLYDVGDLKNDFNGFEFIELEEKIVTLSEGLLHNGKSSVINIFAKKL